MMKQVEKRPSQKEKPVTTDEAHRLIAEKTATFIMHGGQIQQIPRGVTGQAKLLKPGSVATDSIPG